MLVRGPHRRPNVRGCLKWYPPRCKCGCRRCTHCRQFKGDSPFLAKHDENCVDIMILIWHLICVDMILIWHLIVKQPISVPWMFCKVSVTRLPKNGWRDYGIVCAKATKQCDNPEWVRWPHPPCVTWNGSQWSILWVWSMLRKTCDPKMASTSSAAN